MTLPSSRERSVAVGFGSEPETISSFLSTVRCSGIVQPDSKRIPPAAKAITLTTSSATYA